MNGLSNKELTRCGYPHGPDPERFLNAFNSWKKGVSSLITIIEPHS
jgi:hypothetical protein